MSTTVNERRALALRRHAKSPHIIAERKAAIRSWLLQDFAAKQVAAMLDLGESCVCRWARTLGFRLMYVTDAERAVVMHMRRVEKEAAA